MNRAQQILAMTPEQRHRARVRLLYRMQRRRGYPRETALQRALAQHARLIGAIATMEASGWTANPIRVAALAHAAGA